MKITNTPTFLDNSPEGIDLFESKAQDRTAESVANHLQHGNKNFRLIGLDGEWGSGKSNAIKIIKNKLGPSYHLFNL